MRNFQNQTTILLIENGSDWLLEVYSVLQEEGYDVLIATGGDDGFCTARRVRPDLIVCESALTDISGVQLCYMIRADRELSETLFVLMSDADNYSFDADEALLAGANDCFEKNGSRQFLATKIARLIDLQRTETELRCRRQNLLRSESHLTEIIEDTSNLVAALNPAFKFAAFDRHDRMKLKNFFGKNRAAAPPRGLKKSAEDIKIWKRSLQPKERVEAKNFRAEKREKVYYEIVL